MSVHPPEQLESRQSREPRPLDPGFEKVDRTFHRFITVVGLSTLVLTGAIGLFLGAQSIPTLRHYGLGFFTGTQWQPEIDKIGIASVLVGTAEVALVAVCVAFPVGFGFGVGVGFEVEVVAYFRMYGAAVTCPPDESTVMSSAQIAHGVLFEHV